MFAHAWVHGLNLSGIHSHAWLNYDFNGQEWEITITINTIYTQRGALLILASNKKGSVWKRLT